MNGIGDFVTSIKESRRLVAQVVIELKGDVPGHEFHGNQYSEGGGAGGGESSSGSSSGGVSGETYTSGKSVPKKVKDEVSTWEGARRAVGVGAVTQRGDGEVIVGRDGKEVVSAIAFRPPQTTYPIDAPKGEYAQIEALATKRGGYGKQAMTLAAQHAAKSGKGLFLSSRGEAEGFYKSIGMKKAGGKSGTQHFYWTPQQVKKIASEGLS